MSSTAYSDSTPECNTSQRPHVEIVNGEVLLPISWPEFYRWGSYIRSAQRLLERAVIRCTLCRRKECSRHGVYLHPGEVPLVSLWSACPGCASRHDCDAEIARICLGAAGDINHYAGEAVLDQDGEIRLIAEGPERIQ